MHKTAAPLNVNQTQRTKRKPAPLTVNQTQRNPATLTLNQTQKNLLLCILDNPPVSQRGALIEVEQLYK